MDITYFVMLGVGAISLGAGVVVLAWPTRDEIDVMQQVHGDQPSVSRGARDRMSVRILHRVHFHQIEDWLRCGWMVAIPNGPTLHHHYGIEMEWLCDCKMARPR